MDDVRQPGAGLAQRLLGLDLLRLVAILLVLGRHADDAPDSIAPAWQAFFATWKRGGWVGVDLFFVLSGFLVSGLLFAEYKRHGALGIGRFYVRRGFKIYPAFFLLIAATVGYELLDGDRVDPQRVLAEAAFVQNYFDGLWWHSWSLDVEEHFYLALPLALTAVLAWRRDADDPFKPLLAMIAAVLVACLAMRIATWRAHPQVDIRTHIHPTHLRLDSLFFGVGLGYAYHMHPEWLAAAARWRWALIAAGVGVLAIPFGIELESSGFLVTFGLSLFYFGAGLLLVGVLHLKIRRHPLLVALGAIGAFSYSIYLWHTPVHDWGTRILEHAGYDFGFFERTALYMGGALVVGIALALLIEFPALKVRDRLFPARGRAIEVDGAPRASSL